MKISAQAVIFDMDGVITDTMPFHFQIWKQLFKEEGIEVSKEDVYKREGQRGIESLREIFREYGKPFKQDHALRLLQEKEDRFKLIFKRKFISGSRSFLSQLKRKSFRLALVTGTSRQEAVKILPPHLMDIFDVSVCGCDVQKGKPHPEPYLTALMKMSIEARMAVVIENAPFGIQSAKAAGLRCLAIETSLPKSFLHEADGIFQSFKHLKEQVDFINE